QDAVIEVIDSGPGIDPEHRDKIFQRFYSVDKGRSREQGGAGLGLSIVKWAVEAHGGRIEFESETSGPTFRIWLPLVDMNDSPRHSFMRTGPRSIARPLMIAFNFTDGRRPCPPYLLGG